MAQRFLLFTLILFHLPLAAGENWQRIEGNYAIVEFLPQHRAIADSILYISDDVMPELCAWHGVPLEMLEQKKAHVIFTDAPDISNGFAVGETIVIYATSSSYVAGWTGQQNWYRLVVTHELAHHVTFRALQRKLSFLGLVSGLGTPRWFYEGIAQYFAEDWTLTRGDYTLQSNLLSGNFTYNSLLNLNDGRLLYAGANAYIRWLATEYGDSSLIKLMAHNKDGFFYDFDEAFNETYGASPSGLFPEFTRDLILYYGDKLAAYPEIEWATKIPGYGSQTYQVLPFSQEDSSYILLVRDESHQLYLSAVLARRSNSGWQEERLLARGVSTGLVLSRDKKTLAFGKPQTGVENNLQTLSWRWFELDITSGKSVELDHGLRARYGAYDAQGRLYLVTVDGAQSAILHYDDGKSDTLLVNDFALGKIDIGPAGQILVEGQRPDGSRALFELKNGQFKALVEDGLDNRNVVFTGSDMMFFNSYEEEMPVVRSYSFATGEKRTLLKTNRPYFLQSASDTSLIAATINKGSSTITHLPLDSLLNTPAKPREPWAVNRYAGWTTHKPPQTKADTLAPVVPSLLRAETVAFPQGHLLHGFSFALPDYDPSLGFGISGLTTWFEPLQRQTLVGIFGIYPENFDKSLVLIGHYLRAFELEWPSFYYHGPVFFSFDGDEYRTLYRDIISMGAHRTRYIGGNSFAPWTASIDYAWQRFYGDDILEDFQFHGPLLSLGAAWRLPSRYDPFLPERSIGARVSLFRSLEADYPFSVYDAELNAATSFLSPQFGLQTKLVYTALDGDIPPLIGTGIDRFYEYAIPRDLRFSRTIRGVREDIYGDRLLYGTVQLNYLLTERSGLVLLVLPMNNILLSAFGDGARVSANGEINIYSYGAEITFGDGPVRFGAGYALGKVEGMEEDERFFLRFKLFTPSF